jgi:hypothetical protein
MHLQISLRRVRTKKNKQKEVLSLNLLKSKKVYRYTILQVRLNQCARLDLHNT